MLDSLIDGALPDRWQSRVYPLHCDIPTRLRGSNPNVYRAVPLTIVPQSAEEYQTSKQRPFADKLQPWQLDDTL
jgi:hypothetical protein